MVDLLHFCLCIGVKGLGLRRSFLTPLFGIAGAAARLEFIENAGAWNTGHRVDRAESACNDPS